MFALQVTPAKLMGSSDDMYQRGVYDAENDELNPFYYQHYYHYRRGYDKARRQVRQTDIRSNWIRTTLALTALLLISAAGYAFASGLLTSQAQQPRNTPAALAPTAVSPSPRPSPRPTAIATIAPADEPAGLRPGSQARISNLNGATLRARQSPTINAPIQDRIAEGSLVAIVDGPVEADGYTWWLIDVDGAGGWSAERSQDGVVWLVPE